MTVTNSLAVDRRTRRLNFDPALFGPTLALVLMFVIYSVASPHFLTPGNITNVLVQSAPLLILASGQTFALMMGGLDLSQG